MLIFIDCDMGPNGFPISYHTFETDPAKGIPVVDPRDGKTPLTPTQYLNYLATHEDARQKAGWNEFSKLPSLPPNTTRFQALLNVAINQTADPELAALRILV